MERLTESNLLQDLSKDHSASAWLAENVLHPFINGTGAVQIYNNFAKEKVGPAYVAPAKTLSTEWAVHTLASASGAALTYAVVGKAAGMGMGALSSKLGLEGTAANFMNSQAAANIVGAGLYDFAKAPNPGETRLGNAAGSVAAFAAFGMGNKLIGSSQMFAENAVTRGLGRVAVGAAGGLTGLEVGHFVSNKLGANDTALTWDDRFKAMASGGFVNFALPPMQQKLGEMVQAAKNSKPFSMTMSADKESALMKQAVEGTISDADLPTLQARSDAKQIARLALSGTQAQALEAKGDLPTLILLKQQFDPAARQAQMEMVAGELARFMDGAKHSLHAAVYDFRLSDPKVEKLVLDALNGRAESNVDVKLAFFKPNAKADGAVQDGGTAKPNTPVGKDGGIARSNSTGAAEVPAPELDLRGPTPEFLAKLSPKIQTLTVTETVAPAKNGTAPELAAGDGINIASNVPKGVNKVIDVQKGNLDGLEKGVGVNGITGGGHLMHNKYFVRDAGTPEAAIWTGSTNITDSAFGSQDNNIIQIRSEKLAGVYEKNFNELWTKGEIKGTGKDGHATVQVGDSTVTVAFSPGDGKFIDAQFADRIKGMEQVHIASMVISSKDILQALADKITEGRVVTGVYDGPQMANVARAWANSQNPESAEKLKLWNEVKANLIRKNSHPYSPDGPHDYMHNKTVTDGKVVLTGSFNLSSNARSNAENMIVVENPTVATQYQHYIDDLVKTYGSRKN